jgi:hypothetical protein
MLEAPIGIDDKKACFDVIDDESTRKIFIFVIGDRFRHSLPGPLCGALLLPFAPNIVMPSGMSQEITVGLCFRERGRIRYDRP